MFSLDHLGTFDLDNYGDLLYPILLDRILERKTDTKITCRYSLVGGDAPLRAGFRSYPFQGWLTEAQTTPHRIVIGGGDLLRSDCDVIAAHYRASYGQDFKTARQSIGTTEAVGHLLRKYLPRQNCDAFYIQCFKRKRLNYCTFAPFIIDVNNLSGGSSVSYLSCGVPDGFLPEQQAEVVALLGRAQSIYLRDEQSAEKLRRAGLMRDVYVAPDLAVTLSEHFDFAKEKQKGRRILSQMGVNIDRPLVCFQSKPFPGFRAEEIADQLNRYRARTKSEVVLLPLGYCLGDHTFLRKVAGQSSGTLTYANVDSIFAMISIIAASDVFVGTSLHGNITAFSFGIPHLFGPLPVDKIPGFLLAVDLPMELQLMSWSELGDKIAMVNAMDRSIFSDRAQRAQAQVNRVVRAMIEDLSAC